MQLILTQPTTEDIQIKMSTQTETPVNGNIQEISQAFKIDGDTIAALEKNFASELPATEISKNIVFIQEKTPENNTNINCNENCIPEDNVKKSDILESTNNVVSETITNGTSCALDAKEAESYTQNLEMTMKDEIATNVTIDSELCLLNNSSSNLECFTKEEEKSSLVNFVEPLFENRMTTTEESKDISTFNNTCPPVKSLESDKIDINDDASQVKPSENYVSPHTEKLSDETKEVDLITVGNGKCSDDIEMCEEIHKSSENPTGKETTDESNAISDEGFLDNEDVVIHEIDASANVVLSTEDPIVIQINEDMFSPNQTGKNITLPEAGNVKRVEMDKEELLLNQADENKAILETNDSKQVEIDKEELPSSQTVENVLSLKLVDKESVETDKEESLSIQTSKSLILPLAINSKPMDEDDTCGPHYTDENIISSNLDSLEPSKKDEELLSSDQTNENIILVKSDAVNTNDELMEEILPTGQQNVTSDRNIAENDKEKSHNSSISDSVATSGFVTANHGESKEEEPKIYLNNTEHIDTALVHSTEDFDETKVLDDKKNIDNVSMEVDDTEINSLEKENIEEHSNLKNEEPSKDVILESTKPEVTSEIAPNQLLEDITVEKDQKNYDIKENKTELETSHEIVLEKKVTESTLSNESDYNMDKHVVVANKNCSDGFITEEVKDLTKEDQENIEIIDIDDIKIVDVDEETTKIQAKEKSPGQEEIKSLPVVCKLSNTLDILSDDEEEASPEATNASQTSAEEKQCIDLDDDDDIMLIEEDVNCKDKVEVLNNKDNTELKQSDKINVETGEKQSTNVADFAPKNNEKDAPENISSMELDNLKPETENKSNAENKIPENPLLPQSFLKTAKKNLASMTRHELEDFCILRIVESIVDRSNLSDIKTKIKTMAQNLEDYKKRALMMTKQNRDLQVVLKSVQEEQKKRSNVPIQPLKITRSVGMQVLMNDKLDPRRKVPIPNPVLTPTAAVPTGRPVRGTQSVKIIKPPAAPANIPVPRKVPVNNSPSKPITTNTPTNSVGNKSSSPNPLGLRNPSPIQKVAEKRTHSRVQTTSVTVDLTDDEPPAKITNKNPPIPPVRVVPQQNLLAQQRQFPPINNNARKVYIPISGPSGQQMRPGQTYVMKNVPNPGPRPAQRLPIPRPQQQTPIRPKQTPNRHPAPLPESMKQYTPSTWKALPPAPDLKLSKVENGIVISWKIDGYPEGGYETIASYQLYAYQETTAPPCTALWKKIGDVKALPLPMACTLTQFMAGFKYYFAVRAVDVRSRLGPFSLPGSILLLNKV